MTTRVYTQPTIFDAAKLMSCTPKMPELDTRPGRFVDGDRIRARVPERGKSLTAEELRQVVQEGGERRSADVCERHEHERRADGGRPRGRQSRRSSRNNSSTPGKSLLAMA